MNPEQLNTELEQIKSTLGEEETAKIQDSLANIQNLNQVSIEAQKSQQEEIDKLKDDKQKLIASNNNLYQRITTQQSEMLDDDNEKGSGEQKPFNFRNCFDKNGQFIRE